MNHLTEEFVSVLKLDFSKDKNVQKFKSVISKIPKDEKYYNFLVTSHLRDIPDKVFVDFINPLPYERRYSYVLERTSKLVMEMEYHIGSLFLLESHVDQNKLLLKIKNPLEGMRDILTQLTKDFKDETFYMENDLLHLGGMIIDSKSNEFKNVYVQYIDELIDIFAKYRPEINTKALDQIIKNYISHNYYLESYVSTLTSPLKYQDLTKKKELLLAWDKHSGAVIESNNFSKLMAKTRAEILEFEIKKNIPKRDEKFTNHQKKNML